MWLLGGYAPDQAALTRFFSLHYLLPFVIAGVVILHIWALHIPGSGNPTGVDVKDERDTLPFHPFYTAKDGWFAAAVLLVYALVTYFAPELPRPPGQLHPGQPARDARAYRSRMVFLAVLRDPSLVHGRFRPAGQAVGRAGDVQLDPAAVLPPVARQVAGPLGLVPPGVQALLLAAGHRRVDPRLCRRRADQPVARRLGPGRRGLLFPPFPRDPAAGFGVRNAAAAAEFDFRQRSSRRGGGGGAGWGRRSARRGSTATAA